MKKSTTWKNKTINKSSTTWPLFTTIRCSRLSARSLRKFYLTSSFWVVFWTN